jgi:hypothetical protein
VYKILVSFRYGVVDRHSYTLIFEENDSYTQTHENSTSLLLLLLLFYVFILKDCVYVGIIKICCCMNQPIQNWGNNSC